MALRIRAPEEYQDVSVSNNFRPAPIDGSGISSAINNVRREISGVAEIVEQAHDNAMRSQALADSVQYETRLTALRAEMDNEAPPEGVDSAEWARTYPQRWEQRAARIQQEILRGRGARSSRYQNYFNERAIQISGREQGAAIERSQTQIVSLASASGLEHFSLLAAGSTDPDVQEDPVEGSDAPSRSGYFREAEQVAQDLVRRRIWSPTYATERILQLREERENFLETEDRHQRTRAAVDEARAQFPNDPFQQRQFLIERFPRAVERGLAMDYLNSDITQDNALREAQLDAAEERIGQLIGTYGAGWERHASRADRDLVRSNQGAMARVLDHVESITGGSGGGGASASRAASSANVRLMLEEFVNAPNVTDADGNLIDMNAIVTTIDLNAPLSAVDAELLQRAEFDVQEGDVLSAGLTGEDYRAIRQLQQERRTGVRANGDSVLLEEVEDVVRYAATVLAPDFTMSDEGTANRQRRALFSAHVSRILRDQFAEGGYRDLSTNEVHAIAERALRRTGNGNMFGGISRTPDYRRTDVGNTRPWGEIDRATRRRIQAELDANNALSGLSEATIRERIIQRDAEERAAIAAQGRANR